MAGLAILYLSSDVPLSRLLQGHSTLSLFLLKKNVIFVCFMFLKKRAHISKDFMVMPGKHWFYLILQNAAFVRHWTLYAAMFHA